MNSCYLLGGLFFWVCDKFHLLHKYKIQTEKYPTNSDYIRCIVNLVQNYVLVIAPLLYIGYPIFTQLGFSTALPLPSLFSFCVQFLFFALSEDVTHYFLHRALHTKLLYKRIHKIHHLYSAPFGLAASYSHPAEVLILGFCTFSGPLVLRPHYFTFYSWVLYRQLDAVLTHCGYDFPGLADFLPFYGGITAHDYHHKTFIWNFSSRFTFMDKLFGTFKEDKDNSSTSSVSSTSAGLQQHQSIKKE